MRRFLVLVALIAAFCSTAYAQRVTNSGYQTIAHIKSDGTIQDAGYHTIGHIRHDGTIQDAGYHTIGHADGIPITWAAWFFFF